ncbi:MAG: arginine repressor [Lachnospiraceae bacterium]|jgi:transcriptional regulator of arginine metabolism|nr:arginine repressor [Lachnospiraceae bacterium]
MKNARHEQILQLIGVYDIETQEELAEKLNEKGFTVTQATVSRDIRQLQLRKVTGSDGKSHYTLGGSQVDLSRKYKRVLEDAFVSADHAGNIIVIHTVSGMAMAAAAALDSLDWGDVLGCIAGDDTIMVVIREPENASEIIGRIRGISS